MKRLKLFLTFFMVLMMSGLNVSCDKDDLDEFSVSVVKNTWISDKGEVYDFYRSFKGVIFADKEGYDSKTIDKSFIWTETDNELTIAIDGFRNEAGEMQFIAGEDLVLTTYHVKSSSDKEIILSNDSETITLKAYR